MYALLRKIALESAGRAGGWVSAAVGRVAMPLYHRHAPLPAAQVIPDVPYRLGRDACSAKQRLDLFVPDRTTPDGWPTLVFAHGGGWTSGDRAFRFGGADVYGNIGRFFAARGIGAAILSYRLQPSVGWREQVEDVATAVGWVHAQVERFGGDGERLVLSGHSAGAQLVTRVALDPAPLARAGVPRSSIRGLVPISGAGFDLEDERTYALGASRRYYEERFRYGAPADRWRREASTLPFAHPGAPPTLIFHAARDWPALQHQSRLLRAALQAQGVDATLHVVPGVDHYTIVPALSRDDRLPAPAIVAFVRALAPAAPSAALSSAARSARGGA